MTSSVNEQANEKSKDKANDKTVNVAKSSPKKISSPHERVTVADKIKDKLDKWVQQANDLFEGVITITKSDIINMLIKQHEEILSLAELQILHCDHYDEIKVATWLLEKVKESKRNGDHVQLQDLLSKFAIPIKDRKIQKTKLGSISEMPTSTPKKRIKKSPRNEPDTMDFQPDLPMTLNKQQLEHEQNNTD